MAKVRFLSPTIVSNEKELTRAMIKQDVVIYIQNELYDEMFENVHKSIKNKKNSKIGAFVGAAALLMSGPIGWTALLGGVGTFAYNHLKDEFKKYNISIEDAKDRFVLTLKTGPNKYNKNNDNIRG
ncbi:hypothetical protein [[Clostridium] fimetarium]|uniref:Uncharacterized protein n=1 Tax=[Clostridium] fimetarium TaxID=99656 RepID=A0A1I0MYI2_9FIRM|nr:hypothetical protein [[Clostridium] fimetarium]SEV93576.1 hypothetical protein SAMN05421659_102236 [[Clostridium] fimetarium]